MCATAEEWEQLAESYKKSKNRDEKLLYQTLSIDFVPEIPKMIEAKVSSKVARVPPLQSVVLQRLK